MRMKHLHELDFKKKKKQTNYLSINECKNAYFS